MIMLDTNICIYILRDRPIGLLEKLNSAGDISISSIAYAELLFGIELSPKSKRKSRSDQLIRFLQHLTILPWDENAAVHYSQIRSTLKKKGILIGNMDMLIGAHARSLGVDLITNNEKELTRIPDLKIVNWV